MEVYILLWLEDFLYPRLSFSRVDSSVVVFKLLRVGLYVWSHRSVDDKWKRMEKRMAHRQQREFLRHSTPSHTHSLSLSLFALLLLLLLLFLFFLASFRQIPVCACVSTR